MVDVDVENMTRVERAALVEIAAGRVKVRRTALGGMYFTHELGYGIQASRLVEAGLARVTGGGRIRLTKAGRRALDGES